MVNRVHVLIKKLKTRIQIYFVDAVIVNRGQLFSRAVELQNLIKTIFEITL